MKFQKKPSRSLPIFLACIVTLFCCMDSAASLSGRKIGLDPGHGEGLNRGVVIAEGTWSLDAGKRARGHLQNHGATVVMTRTNGSNPSLGARQNILNSNNVHMMVSIHSNAASAGAVGLEAYYCNATSNGTASKALADRLRLRALDMVHNRNRGTKECLAAGRGFHFGMIRWTNMPGSLGEYYFHTNDWENRNLHNTTTGRENIARSLYAAVCDRHGVTPVFGEPPPPSTEFKAGDWVRTTTASLNFRTGPETSDNIIKALPLHTVAQVAPHADNGVEANSNHWWYVQLHPEGTKGWLAEVFLEKTSSPNPAHVDKTVDNSDPGFTASSNWDTASWAPDKHGPDYAFRAVEGVPDTATWTVDVPYAGTYQVYAWWNSADNRSQVAPYFVDHKGGAAKVEANQRENGGQWNLLGTYQFDKGEATVRLSCWAANAGSDIVVADAVRFVTYDEPPPPTLFTLTTSANGSGSILRTPNASTYIDGTSVQLKATPAANYTFSHWSGDADGTQTPVTVTMDSAKSVTAHFEPTTYNLATTVIGSGEIQRTPDLPEYAHGSPVQLQAIPQPGYEFIDWSGDNTSTVNPLNLIITGPRNLTATFSRTYTAWKDQYFTESERADEAISGDKATPGGDNVPNLLKYALGLAPHESPQYALPVHGMQTIPGESNTPYLTLTFSHPTDVSDVTCQVQLSNDLQDWSESAILLSEDKANGTTTQTYRDVTPYNASTQRFIRLRVIR